MPSNFIPSAAMPSIGMSSAIVEHTRRWQERAAEFRALAETVKGQNAKRTMLRIADDYVRLASHGKPVAQAQPEPSPEPLQPEPVAEAQPDPLPEQLHAEPVAEAQPTLLHELLQPEPAPEARPEPSPEPHALPWVLSEASEN
jgi:hypothetical protein